MRLFATFALISLVACGGSEPAPPPAPTAPKVEPEPAPEPEPKVDFAALDEAGQKAHLMTLGEEVYNTGGSGGVACLTCHQATGEGLPGAFPPLKGAGDFYGDCAKHAGFVINGLTGEIEIAGTTYNSAMPAQANLSDMEIAAVITFERNSWGNDDGVCTPDQVKAAR